MSENTEKNVEMENIVSLAKRRGFIYPGSDVYGGLSGTWDYGPLGVALKRNVMQLWWKMFVDDRDDMYGVDAAILMNKKVWEASGHTATFTDPLIECATGNCNMRYRADHLIKDYIGSEKFDDYVTLVDQIREDFFQAQNDEGIPHLMTRLIAEFYHNDSQRQKLEEFANGYRALQFERGVSSVALYLQRVLENTYMSSLSSNSLNDAKLSANFERYADNQWLDLAYQLFLNKNVTCSKCGAKYWALPRQFNMMFKTHVGAIEDDTSISYLRPETAQGIFTNFKNVVDNFYPDLPFGLAQQGKAFRNEISPRDFIFRSREFEQMEIEYFVEPDKWEASFNALLADTHTFLDALGLPQDKVHELEVPAEDRAHYSKRTIDIEYDFPIGKEELMGIAYRTNFDLMNIQNNSGKSMEYTIKGTNTKFVPHVIEPSFGVERAVMAVMAAAYTEDEVNGEKRIVMKFPEHLAPVKYCVSPLLKNKPELVEKAREVYRILKKKHGNVLWDDNGNIGKRYRRQDEIGTPYCVVVDFDSLEDNTVTIRDRDTTEQRRVAIADLDA